MWIGDLVGLFFVLLFEFDVFELLLLLLLFELFFSLLFLFEDVECEWWRVFLFK